MKLAFSSNAFRNYSLIDSIEILSEIGYSGIEIMADIPHAYPLDLSLKDIEKIKDALSRHNMEVSNINAFMLRAEGDVYHPSWIEKDPVLRFRRAVHTLRCVELAANLGAKTVSTEPGGPLNGAAPEEAMRLFKEGLLSIRHRAFERGVKILIEPEPGLLINSGDDFLKIHNELDPEVFGLNFDIGHFYCAGSDCAEEIARLKDFTAHFHLEDIPESREHRHLLPGEGAIDIPGVIKAIRETGYDGYVTVELYAHENNPVEAAARSFEYLSKFIQ